MLWDRLNGSVSVSDKSGTCTGTLSLAFEPYIFLFSRGHRFGSFYESESESKSTEKFYDQRRNQIQRNTSMAHRNLQVRMPVLVPPTALLQQQLQQCTQLVRTVQTASLYVSRVTVEVKITRGGKKQHSNSSVCFIHYNNELSYAYKIYTSEEVHTLCVYTKQLYA